MEENLLRLFKLADELNERQNKVYIEISYCVNKNKRLSIYLRNKENFKYLDKFEIELEKGSQTKWNNIIRVIEFYIKKGGANNE